MIDLRALLAASTGLSCPALAAVAVPSPVSKRGLRIVDEVRSGTAEDMRGAYIWWSEDPKTGAGYG